MSPQSTTDEAVLTALSACTVACETCADACLHEDDIEMMVPCIRLDRNCADICRLTAAFIARGSDHARHVLKECIEICRKCAAECGRHQHCQRCAQACRECVAACEAW